MPYLTLGVLGHVDHGKTALTEALTGVATDRLAEERQRGISIVLGYASLTLPAGEMGIVDAPGHERFIRTMVSGATGIRAILLVVDVNEGVKPQTVEHLDIAGLLGIREGVIAVTKCDTADEELQALVEEEVRGLVEGTFLRDAPIVFTSAVEGRGLDELRGHLNALVERAESPRDEGFPYLPIDRVFTMAGFGTVVTGTLRRGALQTEDEVELYPLGLRARVRGLQIHNQIAEQAAPGVRTAVNLRGVDRSLLHRGHAIAAPGSLTVARLLDVELSLLPGAPAPLTYNQRVRLLTGTQENFARVRFVDRDRLAPAGLCHAQLRLEEPAAVLLREPFVIRTYSPMRTIGGGVILDAVEQRRKRFDQIALDHLKILAQGRPEAMLGAELMAAGTGGASLNRLCALARRSSADVRGILGDVGAVEVEPGRFVSANVLTGVKQDILGALQNFHASEPARTGLSEAELAELLPVKPGPALFSLALSRAIEQKRIVAGDSAIRAAGFDAADALSGKARQIAEELEQAFKEGGLKPSGVEALTGGNRERMKLFKHLVERKVLITIRATAKSTPIVFHCAAIEEAKHLLREHFAESDGFSASEARAVLGTSRKFLIPLLEYLDSQRFTARKGDTRVILPD